MWIAFHNPFELAFARRAKAINLKESNPKGVLRACSCRGGVLERMLPPASDPFCIDIEGCMRCGWRCNQTHFPYHEVTLHAPAAPPSPFI